MLSPEAVEFRKTRIGGSDIAAILGQQKWGGPATLAQRILGKEKPHPYKPEFEFGNRWEPHVAQLFAENHPDLIVVDLRTAHESGLLLQLGFKGRVTLLEDESLTVMDQAHDQFVLNFDYLLVDRSSFNFGVLEIKTASEFANDDWAQTGVIDGAPFYYQDQPKWYAHRLGGSFAYVACLIGQRDYREYPMEMYAPEQAQKVTDEVLGWWQRHIEQKLPVMADLGEANDLVVAKDQLQADEQLMGLIRRHKSAYEEKKEAERIYKDLDDQVRALCAEYEELVSPEGVPLFTNGEKSSDVLDTAALARYEPEVFARYLKPKMQKRFAKASGYKKLAFDRHEIGHAMAVGE